MIKINFNQLSIFCKDRDIGLIGETNENMDFRGVKPINTASVGDISFCRFDGEKGMGLISGSNASFILIPESLALDHEYLDFLKKAKKLFGICKHPRFELAWLLKHFWINEESVNNYKTHKDGGLVHLSSIISDTARVHVGAVVKDGVVVGEGTVIETGAVVSNSIIGNHCLIGSNSVIGGVGFGFETDQSTKQTIEFPHIGLVRIGDRVRVGGGTCIDRASIGETIVMDDVKIDNLVHIAHNAKIGKGTKIVALSIIGGSATIGEGCWLAPSVAIRDWISLGDNSIIGMGAVVTKSVAEGKTVVGNPAKEIEISKKRYL
jgi:UDP-3-O-[3-hydroxymyristoyl] glucosamine N-acyltransferase